METATKLLVRNVRELGRYWYWDEVTAKENELISSDWLKTVTETTRTKSKVFKLLFSRLRFISVDERWFWRYATDTSVSVQNRYVAQVLKEDYVCFLGVQIELYELYDDMP